MVAMGVNFSFKQLLSAFLRNIRIDQRELSEEQEDKWCGYGCYCTPTQKHLAESDWVGRGEPVDPIDALCMQLWKCYQCLDLEFNKCPPSTPYGWKGPVYSFDRTLYSSISFNRTPLNRTSGNFGKMQNIFAQK